MCQFCHTHGEGKKWYLQAKNYSEDLLSDMRRREMMTGFFRYPHRVAQGVALLKMLDWLPLSLRRRVGQAIGERQKSRHFGQVIPIEDVEKILGLANSVVRLACICRKNTVGSEQRYCYGVSMGPQGGVLAEFVSSLGSFVTGPETKGLEVLTKEETLTAFREYERQGICHTVWTFETPFIGGICNCNTRDCLAMRALARHTPVFFRAEYIIELSNARCRGCRRCLNVCPFEALVYREDTRQVWVNPMKCYGCGICRSVCSKEALVLRERHGVPEAANLW